MPLKVPGKETAKGGLVTPGKFQIKRAEQINNVLTTPKQDLVTLEAIQQERAGERIDDLPSIIRFRRSGVEIEIVPDPSQITAVKSVIHQQVACITGAAGTGKTTVERIILSKLEQGMQQIDTSRYGKDAIDPNTEGRKPNKVPSIAFCAFTGKAMQQMKKNLPEDYAANCYTIHYLLGFYPEWYDVEMPDPERPGKYLTKIKMRFIPWYDRSKKLPWRVIVVDEASMVPIDLWNQLIDACLPNTRIILIGDINQLPPVMGRSVFGYALQKWPSFELTQIHRQKGSDNPIVDNAWKILQGKQPVDVPGKFDIIECPKSEVEALKMLLKVTLLMYKKEGFDPMPREGNPGDMIIVPQNKSEIGQTRINELLIPYFNPADPNPLNDKGKRHQIVAGFEHKSFAVGDKVMATVNDYSTGVTNGMIGVIIGVVGNEKYMGMKTAGQMQNVHVSEAELDKIMNFNLVSEEIAAQSSEKDNGDLRTRAASHIVTVDFGLDQLGNPVIVDFSSAGQVNSLMLANAATCHKCQGSEFKTVIVLCHSANSTMLYREWLYTAVTRASERVILVHDRRGLLTALNRQRIKGKNLKEKAQAFIDWTNESLKFGKEADLPMLWEPKEI